MLHDIPSLISTRIVDGFGPLPINQNNAFWCIEYRINSTRRPIIVNSILGREKMPRWMVLDELKELLEFGGLDVGHIPVLVETLDLLMQFCSHLPGFPTCLRPLVLDLVFVHSKVLGFWIVGFGVLEDGRDHPCIEWLELRPDDLRDRDESLPIEHIEMKVFMEFEYLILLYMVVIYTKDVVVGNFSQVGDCNTPNPLCQFLWY